MTDVRINLFLVGVNEACDSILDFLNNKPDSKNKGEAMKPNYQFDPLAIPAFGARPPQFLNKSRAAANSLVSDGNISRGSESGYLFRINR